MNIVVGCDHRGLDLKQSVIQIIARMGHGCEDAGCYTAESVDYPDIAQKVAQAVAGGKFAYGILICDTGIGMSVTANKIGGIRAALCHDSFSAGRARQHNDAHVLCLSATGNPEAVFEILDTFLATQFEGGRHLQRLNKIKALEG